MNMFLSTVFCVLYIFACFQESLTFPEDYYWREYTGTIPKDAIIGGKDINGQKIFIGQAYVRNVGLIVAAIYPERREVHLHLAYILYTINSYIKILCGKQQNFYWAPTNSSDFHLFLLDKHAVIGGHVPEGILNIGRMDLEGETKIGRIHSYIINKPDFDISHKGKETPGISTFEVLIYKENQLDERTDLTHY